MSLTTDKRLGSLEQDLNRAHENSADLITVDEAIEITRPLEERIISMIKRAQLLVRKLASISEKAKILKDRG